MRKEAYIWDKIAKSFHVTSSRSRGHRDKYSNIAEIILAFEPKNILDLGCGSGILEKEIYEKGYRGRVTAIDNSASMLEIARSLVTHPGCRFVKSDIDYGLGKLEKFDLIVSINLFFFLNNKKKFLRDISKQLKSDKSIFIMVTPKPENETSNIEFVKEHFRDTDLRAKFLITLNELTNIPYYMRMTLGQRKVSSLAKQGKIIYERPEQIQTMAERVNLDIIKTEEIQANQNWLFIMKRRG